jgi:hypothetical protein
MASKARKKRNRVRSDPIAEPTQEQFDKGTFYRAGPTWRRMAVIDTLLEQGKLTARQHGGLARYRDVAGEAERSETTCSLDFSVRGSGEGLPHFGVRMNLELARLERELGSLRPIAYAIAVRDLTVSQWAMEQSGALERERTIGEKIIRWFEPRRKAHETAMTELRFAGEWLAAAIGC